MFYYAFISYYIGKLSHKAIHLFLVSPSNSLSFSVGYFNMVSKNFQSPQKRKVHHTCACVSACDYLASASHFNMFQVTFLKACLLDR